MNTSPCQRVRGNDGRRETGETREANPLRHNAKRPTPPRPARLEAAPAETDRQPGARPSLAALALALAESHRQPDARRQPATSTP